VEIIEIDAGAETAGESSRGAIVVNGLETKEWAMRGYIRSGLIISAVVFLILTAGFFFRFSWATRLWPWVDSRLSFIFVASILAAMSIPILWIGVTGEFGAAEAGALELIVTYLGVTVYLSQLYARHGGAHLLIAAIVCGVGWLSVLSVYLWSRRIPLRDPRPMPLPVRLSFGVFTLALVIVGVALIKQAPHIFPWPLNPSSSVIYGWIFLGASVYFLHGALRPRWANTCGQLLGFLAYDLILIGPFLHQFATVKPEHRTSLIVYTSVLLYSGLLASYYLFINRATRIWSTAAMPAARRAM
jgi:hypothetical protein